MKKTAQPSIPVRSAPSAVSPSADQKLSISSVVFGSVLSLISMYLMYLFFGIFILAAQYVIPGIQTGPLINLILLIEWVGIIYLNVRAMTNFLNGRKNAIGATIGALLIIGVVSMTALGAR